jgi:ubiquinol-cytochrome c reductase cytochrome c subunit
VRLLSKKITRGLSAKRRSRFAAPLVLVIGLLATGGAYAAFAPANASTSTDDAATVAKGRALFLVGCASCHGKNAEGIVTQRGNEYGPALAGVGAAAVDFQVGTGRMPLAQPGAQALRKESLYTPQETEALAAYVASLGPGPAVPDKSEYDVNGVTNEDMVKGGEFFRTNCTACHNFAGAGGALPQGKFAPSLRGVSEKHMFEAMLTGPQQMPVFSNDVLTSKDKQDIIAYLKKNEKTPNYGGFTLGSLGPVTEGLGAWLIGMGALVGAAIWIAAHTARSKKKVEA